MLEFIRDSAWQFGGFVLGLIAIVVSVVIFFKQKSIKNLSYIKTNTPLLRVNEKIKNRVKILLDDKPVENVHSILIKIVNNGNASINPEDFKVPLNILFDVPVKEVYEVIDVDKDVREEFYAEEKEREKRRDELKAQKALLAEKITHKVVSDEEAAVEQKKLDAIWERNSKELDAAVKKLNTFTKNIPNSIISNKVTVNQLSIIEANVTESYPSSILNQEKNLITISDNRVEIKPILLNKEDWFTVAITASNSAGPIEDKQVKVDARIDGVKEIKPYVAPKNPIEVVFLITYSILVLTIIIFGNSVNFTIGYLIALFFAFILSQVVSFYFKRKSKFIGKISQNRIDF